jgi:hypothetical protein
MVQMYLAFRYNEQNRNIYAKLELKKYIVGGNYEEAW